ncbi:unnamed protein product [Lepeophtheirus salmonis]|uniref:(salmon louse) hypothetical protein n=1 Tax=Lepeophtheirus salmonis TaxID=72036 RepID=A0A7R8H078_LEPSM|nr:unnamed protein product [Lepeophtheirus salmonis]CAF2779067.1 unnamed protein product [Lepeophtheirus salmonis]
MKYIKSLYYVLFNQTKESTRLNPKEVEKFRSMDWWGPKCAPLKSMNRLRVPWIVENSGGFRPGVTRILDVGCGGGILSEPLARLQGLVTDEEESHIYPKFDIVVASEVIEHVENPSIFISHCASLLKESGSLYISTINRTPQSWLGAIVAAEYMCGLLPRERMTGINFLNQKKLRMLLQKQYSLICVMKINIEIKARLPTTDLAAFRAKVEALGPDGPVSIIKQEDTFFKRSKCSAQTASDQYGPKGSVYEKVPVIEPQSLKRALEMSHGIKGTVSKTRYLYVIGQTRVHCDAVKDYAESIIGHNAELPSLPSVRSANEENQVHKDKISINIKTLRGCMAPAAPSCECGDGEL